MRISALIKVKKLFFFFNTKFSHLLVRRNTLKWNLGLQPTKSEDKKAIKSAPQTDPHKNITTVVQAQLL